MAVNETQSLNGALAEGMTDSRYKKIVVDRGGAVDPGTHLARRDLHPLYYGVHEARQKVAPDGSVVLTPDFVATPDPLGSSVVDL